MDLRVAVEKKQGEFHLSVGFSLSGDRIGLFGPSGSGKSTLVSLLAGLAQPDSGEIVLDGEMLFSGRDRIFVPPEKRRIGLVFQHPHLFPHLNVRSNLLYGHRRCAPENRRIGFDSLVEVLGIGDILERGVNHLSGGEKQRVAIGRAVLSNPRLLLLDEPLSALDDRLKFQIVPYLKAVCGSFGIPYLFVSHSLVEMRLMTDQVLVLGHGKVAAAGESPDGVARRGMQHSQVGYINLLPLRGPGRRDGLFTYSWGRNEIVASVEAENGGALFELSSRDIILFRKHPEAISARNLLRCTVTGTFPAGNRTGVDLDCGGERLVAEIASKAAEDLTIGPGTELYAAVKASAFRPLGMIPEAAGPVGK
jgi:molybdate transport system ATP-binding protein